MDSFFLPRTLRYQADGKTVELPHTELIKKFGSSQPLIVLGEAGLGKTGLLGWIARNNSGYRFLTADQLLRPPRSMANIAPDDVLVIDGLDELSVGSSQHAIDQVLEKLIEKRYPSFILSCRAADWFGAYSAAAVKSVYEQAPAHLHLQPLNDDGIQRFLEKTLKPEQAVALIEHFRSRRLGHWLGNPYTLELLIESAQLGELPEYRSDLFRLATEQLLKERNKVKAIKGTSKDNLRHGAGAACAALILAGHRTLSLDGEQEASLRLDDLEALPGTAHLRQALDTRVFVSSELDTFKYPHRSLAEYLAANWLTTHANTTRKRQRLLAMIQREAHVPAHLRGLHAWLALDGKFAEEVIAADPMGIFEHGCADHLIPEHAKRLLLALRELAQRNPGFLPRDHRFSFASLVKPYAYETLQVILADKAMPFDFRLLLLQGLIKHPPVGATLQSTLEGLVLDPNEAFALRQAALERLSPSLATPQATTLVSRLKQQGSNDASQLALNTIALHGCGGFADALIARYVIACSHHPDRILEFGTKYASLIRHFPAERLTRFLDVLTGMVRPKPLYQSASWHNELAVLVIKLIGRCLQDGKVVVSDLWRWLEFAENHVATFFLASELRPHFENEALREEVLAFAASQAKSAAWVDWLCSPAPNDEHPAPIVQRQRPLPRPSAELLQRYRQNLQAIESGAFEFVLEAALVYLDESQAFPSSTSAYERLHLWLGQSLAQSFLLGFENYLLRTPGRLSRVEVAERYARQRCWPPAHAFGTDEGLSPFIIYAALSERQRSGKGFTDLDDDVLIIGFLAVHYLDKDHLFDPALKAELRERTLLQETLQLRCEPHLRNDGDGLCLVLQLDTDRNIAFDLARQWLTQFDHLDVYIERDLVSVLLHGEQFEALRTLAATRPRATKEHRLLWYAVGLIVEFDDTRGRLEASGQNKHLLHELRELVIGHFPTLHKGTITLPPSLMAWIIQRFRSQWPYPERRIGDVCGDDFLAHDLAGTMTYLIDTLGSVTSPDAIDALRMLCAAERDTYSDRLLDAKATQHRLSHDAKFETPTLADLQAAMTDTAPRSEAELQNLVLLELGDVQAKISSNDVDSWKVFYRDDGCTPQGEEYCRDRLMSLLRQSSSAITYAPEGHLANDKRADITCSVVGPRLSIEVKGQWHKSVWTAADQQLAARYATDHLANGYGIYLVLWFGEQTSDAHALTSPGRKIAKPTSASTMKTMLEQCCLAYANQRVQIVVLDLSRPTRL